MKTAILLLIDNYRQTHKSFFQKSGLFFVCLLRPLSFDIKLQDVEIKAAQVTTSLSGGYGSEFFSRCVNLRYAYMVDSSLLHVEQSVNVCTGVIII